MIILGIDPGKLGGAVMLDGLNVVYQRRADGPGGYWRTAARADPDPGDLLDLWADVLMVGRPALVVVEAPAWNAATRMNAGTAGRLGIEHGCWRTLLACHGVPYEVLRPQVWRKRAGIVVPQKGDPKVATVARVRALLPGLDLTPGRVTTPHDGLADAAGLALAGRTT